MKLAESETSILQFPACAKACLSASGLFRSSSFGNSGTILSLSPKWNGARDDTKAEVRLDSISNR
jgi:hypothetical protein